MCIVMEYCGWGDLAMKIKRYVKRREYIDERVIWVYMIQILEGLKALHERNVLHRDLKPANCFLAEDGSIKIGDMNVSKVMKDGNAKTQIGTPYYMSPEIWARRPYNHATDIWSLGCLIYELCALRPPFLGNNMSELKTAVLGGNFNPVPSVYSKDLGSVIARMLLPAARDRPSAAEALAYPEVNARKCLVKNVLREEELYSKGGVGGYGAEDALMPTIHIGSLRELGVKLPGPSYPSDGPPTPTTPIMLAHDASPVNEKATLASPIHHRQKQEQEYPASGSPSHHRRAGLPGSKSESHSPLSPSIHPIGKGRQQSPGVGSLDRDLSGAKERGSASYPQDRRRVPTPPPNGAPAKPLPIGRIPSQGKGSSAPSSSPPVLKIKTSSSGSGHVTPVGGVGDEYCMLPRTEQKNSVKNVLQAAQKEISRPPY